MAYNERGEEILDDTPIEVPLKFKRPPSIQEMIQLYVRSELQVRGLMAPDATSEEDFDVGDDAADDILTPYELHALAADMEASLPRKKKEVKDGKEVNKVVGSGEGGSGRVAEGTAGEGGSGPDGAGSGAIGVREGEKGSSGKGSGAPTVK